MRNDATPLDSHTIIRFFQLPSIRAQMIAYLPGADLTQLNTSCPGSRFGARPIDKKSDEDEPIPKSVRRPTGSPDTNPRSRKTGKIDWTHSGSQVKPRTTNGRLQLNGCPGPRCLHFHRDSPSPMWSGSPSPISLQDPMQPRPVPPRHPSTYLPQTSPKSPTLNPEHGQFSRNVTDYWSTKEDLQWK
jgi:hypothetical protein